MVVNFWLFYVPNEFELIFNSFDYIKDERANFTDTSYFKLFYIFLSRQIDCVPLRYNERNRNDKYEAFQRTKLWPWKTHTWHFVVFHVVQVDWGSHVLSINGNGKSTYITVVGSLALLNLIAFNNTVTVQLWTLEYENVSFIWRKQSMVSLMIVVLIKDRLCCNLWKLFLWELGWGVTTSRFFQNVIVTRVILILLCMTKLWQLSSIFEHTVISVLFWNWWKEYDGFGWTIWSQPHLKIFTFYLNIVDRLKMIQYLDLKDFLSRDKNISSMMKRFSHLNVFSKSVWDNFFLFQVKAIISNC